MSARILVVDDIDVNVRLLEAKLLVEYYDVITAKDGPTALELAKSRAPDLVLLDVMMPGMDGFEVCRRMRADPDTAHIPIVMVTALSETSDRVMGLEAGADDFLTKPVNDVALYARIRSLVRLKRAGDEWRTREVTFVRFGAGGSKLKESDEDAHGHILLVMEDNDAPETVIGLLEARGHTVVRTATAEQTRVAIMREEFDLILVNDGRGEEDALRLCSMLRSEERTRQAPILLMVFGDDMDRLAKALELGVNDYLVKPIEQGELHARSRSQIRRKRYEDELRANYHRSMTAALTDDLTGLNNRRFLEAHYEAVIEMLADTAKPVSLMILDVDNFKNVNDRYGHGVGDVVLQGVAGRMLTNLRGFDTAIRYGGEEFVVLMPNIPPPAALAAAQRLCRSMAATPFSGTGDSGPIPVTVSIGVATVPAGEKSLDELVHLADEALYEAKRTGRDKVVVAGEPASESVKTNQPALG